MENYILKLNSGTEYKLYKGTTLVSDADLTTLFGVAGEMYLSFDFNSGTPSDLTAFTITDSSDNAVITNTNVTVAEGKNYKATWSASATTFDTFEELEGKALDESQLSFLMEEIKERPIVGSTLSTPSSVAYVATDNIQDGAVTADKMDLSTMGYNSTNAVVIGSFVDSNNTSHTIYRKMYKFTDYTINTTDNYKQYQLDLANYTIVGSEVSLYRTDAAGVINTAGTDLAAIFTGSGDYVRIYCYGNAAQTNATVYLTVDYMD